MHSSTIHGISVVAGHFQAHLQTNKLVAVFNKFIRGQITHDVRFAVFTRSHLVANCEQHRKVRIRLKWILDIARLLARPLRNRWSNRKCEYDDIHIKQPYLCVVLLTVKDNGFYTCSLVMVNILVMLGQTYRMNL